MRQEMLLRFIHVVGCALVLLWSAPARAEYRVGIYRQPNQQSPTVTMSATGPAPVFETRPSDNSARNFFRSTLLYEIAVFNTSTGAIIPNATITLASVTGRANSGGHDHDDSSRPAGSFSYLSRNTGPAGTDFAPTFTAPEVSGIVDVVVTCSVPSGTFCATNTLPIAVRIPELAELSPGVDYVLTGSFGSPGVTSQHIANHFGRASFVAKLQALATTYYLAYPNQPDKVRINDMSLVEGGLFDANNNWQPPSHWEHRIGISADIGLVPPSRRPALMVMMLLSGITGTLYVEGNHWHIRESGSSQ